MNKPAKLRLDALDGLRGLAIVFVVLNHMDSAHIVNALPIFLRPFISFLFSSGTIAVTFFYILSGFLMGYLYKNPQPHDFIQKRYARIFPPFLVMVICMTIFRLYPESPLIVRMGTILACAGFVRLLWIHFVERFHIGSRLVNLFILLQAAVFVWYGLVIMRHPPIWFAALPLWMREITITLVNGTLMLPAGDYIPLLDGVYWSLIGEVLFYVLYPYLIAPTARILGGSHKLIQYITSLLLVPFFFGLHSLFTGFRGFSMIYVEYFLYFCVGIIIAHSQNIHKSLQLPKIVSTLLPVGAAIAVFAGHELLFTIKSPIHVVISLLLAFPFGLIVYLTVRAQSLQALFRHPFLLYLGSVSYPLYIVHTSIVDGLHLHFRPTSIMSNLIFIVVAGLAALFTAHLFHHILEKLYFQFKPSQTNERKITHTRYRIVLIIFTATIIGILVTKYMTGYTFFSRVYSHTNTQTKYNDQSPTFIELTDTPLVFEFISPDDNLGIITLKIEHTGKLVCTPPNPNEKQMLEIMIKEKNAKEWHAVQKTNTAEIGTSDSFPFGFPSIPQSKNKTFLVQMRIVNHHSKVLLHTQGTLLKSIHQLNKRQVITRPKILFEHLQNKIYSVFTNRDAQLVVFSIFPLLLLVFIATFNTKSKKW